MDDPKVQLNVLIRQSRKKAAADKIAKYKGKEGQPDSMSELVDMMLGWYVKDDE